MSGHIKKYFVLLLIFITGLFPVSEVLAEFNDVGMGARPVAMGSAFAGLADDANCIYYNPAGLGMINTREVTGSESWLFLGLTDGSRLMDGFVSYIHPISRDAGTLGVGWVNRSLRDNNALVGGVEDSLTRYAENAFILSYGRDISGSLKSILKSEEDILGSLLVGLNVKFMMMTYGLDDYSMDAITAYGTSGMVDPVFGETGSNNTRMFASYDLGVFYRPRHQRLSFGLSVTDINSPSTALSEDIDSAVGLSRLPAGLRVGAAYREPLMNVVFDIKTQGNDLDFHAGIERWFHGRDMALRAGYSNGSRSFNNISVGACYRYGGRYRLDYVFLYPLSGLAGMLGTHRVSLTVTLGELTVESEIRKAAQSITRGINKARKLKNDKIRKLDILRDRFLQKTNR